METAVKTHDKNAERWFISGLLHPLACGAHAGQHVIDYHVIAYIIDGGYPERMAHCLSSKLVQID
jgi:hypothetical protein